MVLPIKVFKMNGVLLTEPLVQRLKDFHEGEPYETEGRTVELTSEVLDLRTKDDLVSGVFSRDFVRRRFYKRQVTETLVTEEAPFWIKLSEDMPVLLVLAPSTSAGGKKLLSNHVANTLSEVLFSEPWEIVEGEIAHEKLRELHEANPQATKLIWFDEVDIPSVEKLCLAGSSLADTKLYNEYLSHGKIWYVVFEVQKRGIVVGITRNCVVTLFSKSSAEDFVDYILEDLVMLIE